VTTGVQLPSGPSDRDLAVTIEAALAGDGARRVGRIRRQPFAYATSFAIDELAVDLDDGTRLELLLKHLSWDDLRGDATHTKPPFLFEPRRCVDTYRSTLAGQGFGARCYGTAGDDCDGRWWVLIEKLPGDVLWQVGDFDVWLGVSRWLARFHRHFAARVDDVKTGNPHLLRYQEGLLGRWPHRALALADAKGLSVVERDALAGVVAGYLDVVTRLEQLPPTFLHGELYPSNVIVDSRGGALDVWPIDWEMAAVGPGFLDVAALVTGWDAGRQVALVGAYVDELGHSWGVPPAEVVDVVTACQLHFALQWFGWASGWLPPAAHDRDWLWDIFSLGSALGLCAPPAEPRPHRTAAS
jgi:hypothetical protein